MTLAISMDAFLKVFLSIYVYSVGGEICTSHQNIYLEPYKGTGIMYPKNYPSNTGFEKNLMCTWSITTKTGFHIVVFPVVWSCGGLSSLSLFYGLTDYADIDSCIGCPFDKGFCNKLIQTQSSEASLDLYTMDADSIGGFDFRFLAINASIKADKCKSSVTTLRAIKTAGYIISPNFPEAYPSNLDCTWRIEPDVIDENTQLVFQFQSENLERNDINSCADYVDIEGLGVFCETSSNRQLRPSPIMTKNSAVTTVRFVTDFGAGGTGFVLSFYLEALTSPSSITPIITTESMHLTTLPPEAVTTAATMTNLTSLPSETISETRKILKPTETTNLTTLTSEPIMTTAKMTNQTTMPLETRKILKPTETTNLTTLTSEPIMTTAKMANLSTVPLETRKILKPTETTNLTTLTSEPIMTTATMTNLTTLPSEIITTIATTTTTKLPNILHVLRFESSRLQARESNSIDFQVSILSNTPYEFKWYHNGYLITSSSTRYKMSTRKIANGTSLHTLNISKALQRDKGEWKINVTNGVEYYTRNLTVTVIPRLILQMTPQYDFSIQHGDAFTLQCTVINPDSLIDVNNGSLLLKKDGSILPVVNNTETFAEWRKSSAAEDDSGGYTCTHSGYPDPVYASVTVTVIKPEQKTCKSENSNEILWNTTLANTMKKGPCPPKQKGIATRYCNPDGAWESPNLINCTTEAFVNASSELDSILEDGIRNQEKILEAVTSTLQVMENLTSSSPEMSAGDLSSSMDILEKIIDVTNSTAEPTIKKEVFFSVVDNVLSSNNTKSWTAVSEKTEKDASSVLKNIDRLSEVVIQTKNITATKFTGSNFELTINKTKIDETGIRFPDLTSQNISGGSDEFSTFLELPKQDTKAKKAINYVAVIYKSIAEILPSNSDQDVIEREGRVKKKAFVNSQVLSLTTQTDIGPLSPPLNLTFQRIQTNTTTDMQAVCVSWDYNLNKWTERGCKVGHNDHKRTVCQCYHLTNFAILMRPYTSSQEDKQSLKTTSLVGVILSIVFTALTFLIYIFNWRFIKGDQNVMMLNLCVSLVLAYVVFISAVEKTKSEGLCIAITAILHYLFLVTFFNMLGIGVFYFMSITVTYYAMHVANNFKSKSRVNWFLVGAWGIPLVISSSTLGGFWNKEYHLDHYCWLSVDSGSLYLFTVPVCCIVVINIFIIVTLIRVLCATSVMMKSNLKKKAASGLRSLGTLLPVLGVTWLFGILAINENAEIFQYLFILANSLQGFFIFVSHVVMNKKLMQGLRTKYPSLGVLTSLAEPSKKDASVSRSHSFTSDDLMNKSKKGRFFSRFFNFCQNSGKQQRIVKTYDSFSTERTTNNPSSVLQEEVTHL